VISFILGNINQTYRNYQGTLKNRHSEPVQRDHTHPETADRAKEAVYDYIVWGNPAYPSEHAESSPQIPWDPKPQEAAQTYKIQEALP